jgi:hypothetical protein
MMGSFSKGRNMSVEEYIQQVQSLAFKCNSGANSQELEALEQGLACQLPESILTLYKNHNGIAKSYNSDARLPFRLMSVAETLEFGKATRKMGWFIYGFRVFWTDDNSNYAGLYVAEPLLDYVCLIYHSEPDFSPVYGSIKDFLQAMLNLVVENKDANWYAMSKDYPKLAACENVSQIARDWAASQTLMPKFQAAVDEFEREQWAFIVMSLIPFEHNEALLAFLDDDDMYIQERACDIIGQRKYEAAIPKLEELAAHGISNAQVAAQEALGKFRHNP